MARRSFTLILVRHGETDDNVNRIIQGQKDTPLNDNGRDQARKLGVFFVKHSQKFDMVIASDLNRTSETAKLALAGLGVGFQPEVRIRERSFGILEGLPFAALKEAARKENETTASYRPEKGESNLDMRERAAKYFEDLCDQVFSDPLGLEHVALFTHGGWIRELCIHFSMNLHCEMQKVQQLTQVCPNTGVTSFLVSSKNGKIKLELIKWHDISHLDPEQPVIESLGI